MKFANGIWSNTFAADEILQKYFRYLYEDIRNNNKDNNSASQNVSLRSDLCSSIEYVNEKQIKMR